MLWFGRCGSAVLFGRCGSLLLWFGYYGSVAMSLSRYKSVAMGDCSESATLKELRNFLEETAYGVYTR